MKLERYTITDTHYNLVNEVSELPWACLEFNGLLGEFTLNLVVREISQAQVEFALAQLKDLNDDLNL